MPDIVDPFKATRKPSPIERQRDLGMRATEESIASARVNQWQGAESAKTEPVTRAQKLQALKIDQQTAADVVAKAAADRKKAEADAAALEKETSKPGQYGQLSGASETKNRIQLGLAAAAEAQQNMWNEERWDRGKGRNPFLSSPGAVVAKVTEAIPMTGLLGGPTFQRYQQAAKSWESAFMPIFSGAQVSPSEAARQIKARLPAPDDTPEILKRKARERMMMTNAAADMAGQPRPFPEVGILAIVKGKGVPMSVGTYKETPRAAAKGRPTGPKVGDVMKGYRYKGGDPADKNSWVKVTP